MVTSETKKRLLLSKWHGDQATGAQDRGNMPSWLEELHGRDEQLEQTLTDVRYWLHDGLVMHRLVSDPRQLLRKVEDALS